jgi:hypothetical protein
MKKLVLSIILGVSISTLMAQVPRTVLVEHFTQASCGPCASQNPTLYQTLDAFGSANYVKVTYQVSWPGYDPMNDSYPSGPEDRRQFYGVTGVPNANINGGSVDLPNTAVNANLLAAASALTTPYEMKITQTWNNINDLEVEIKVINTTSATVSDANRLIVAMVENHVSYADAPGSNGETDFYFVTRNMYDASSGNPSTSGATLGSINAGDSAVFSFNVTNVPNYIRDYSEVSFAAFVQNSGTKEVFQATESTPSSTIPGALDVSATSTSNTSSDLCDYAFTPEIEFTNNGSTVITSVSAAYQLNGGSPVMENVTGLSLGAGQSTSITFPQVNLPEGNNEVVYGITDINNGGKAISPAKLALPIESYIKVGTSAQAKMKSFDFDNINYGELPTDVFEYNPTGGDLFCLSSANVSGLGHNLGGFGNSDGCVRWRFFNFSTLGEEASIFTAKLDLSDYSEASMSFSHAYAQISSENDELQVSISTDCGSTWTEVWSKSGADLATVAPLSSSQYYADVDDWVGDTIDISEYAGETEVMVKFNGISDGGNSLFVDDIFIADPATGGTIFVNVSEVEELANVELYPNPSNGNVFINTPFNETDVEIFDAIGNRVLVSNIIGSGNQEIATDLAAGIYMVNLTSNGETTQHKLVVK